MLVLSLTETEYFDSTTREFIYTKPVELKLEHSLLSISKWESIWKIPFLYTHDERGNDTKTREQLISYVKCMTLNKNVPDEVYSCIGTREIMQISEYINSELTATWFKEEPNGAKGESTKLTSELIYYLMTANQIPWEAEKWHLSRLFTLLRICDVKSKKEKKMSKAEQMAQQRNLNASRRKSRKSKG